ncbi:hypothetical protein SLEP1_g54972 [Rubroshorea leprosula]|uniref:Uncharacterized protein n=1 Tax=Rubroshorea leprosula TaxID=152421 RepID=A0AAV5ME16_9ROSI|nr:hypothetical protein SLEP1_g54972 [Rubroshorea leprosula]
MEETSISFLFPCPPFQVVRPDAWGARGSDELDG